MVRVDGLVTINWFTESALHFIQNSPRVSQKDKRLVGLIYDKISRSAFTNVIHVTGGVPEEEIQDQFIHFETDCAWMAESFLTQIRHQAEMNVFEDEIERVLITQQFENLIYFFNKVMQIFMAVPTQFDILVTPIPQ